MKLQEEQQEDLKKSEESLSLGLTMNQKGLTSLDLVQKKRWKRKKARRTLKTSSLKNKDKKREEKSLLRRKKKEESRKRKREKQDLTLSSTLLTFSKISLISSTEE